MDRRIRRTLEFLERAESAEVAVRDLAARVNLSRSRFAHLFKSETGCSITRFLRRRQLARAMELIAGTELRIRRIGELSGFPDHANFDHAFRREFGISPRACRRALAEQKVSDPHQETASPAK